VLLGDCLFAHALRLSTNFSNNEICRIVSEASAEVCTGEIIQTQRRFDLNLSVADYYKIIEMKTAALFGAACELGAFISEASPEIIGSLKTFGARLGTAYQIYDDILDIEGDEEEVGKTLGTDFQKGKLTLPVLLLLQSNDSALRDRARELLLHEHNSGREELAALLESSGMMKAAIDTAKRMVGEARTALDPVPANKYRNGLVAITGHLDHLLGQF